MSTADHIIDLFSSYEGFLSEEQLVREKIYDVVKELEKVTRAVSTLHQKIHLDGGLGEVQKIIQETRELVKSSGPLYQQLALSIPPNEFYKYHDSWKFVTQRLVFAVALMHFIETKQLVSKEDAAALLSLTAEPKDGFHLDLEDYLHGLLSLTSELARLAVTSATAEDYKLPREISKFVSMLNAGFMLMNFKNDSLRKRYDALKYDQKKIEEILLDLSIRGLKPDD